MDWRCIGKYLDGLCMDCQGQYTNTYFLLIDTSKLHVIRDPVVNRFVCIDLEWNVLQTKVLQTFQSYSSYTYPSIAIHANPGYKPIQAINAIHANTFQYMSIHILHTDPCNTDRY